MTRVPSFLLRSLVFLCVTSIPLSAQAPAFNPLIGTWTLEIVDNILPDGSRVHLYGDKPAGLLMFDAAGNYTLQIMRSDRQPFGVNDRLKGTDAENRATIGGMNTHFGHYTISATGDTLISRIEHASFPNWEGTTRPSRFTLQGDRLTILVARPTTGSTGTTGEVVWRRVRP